MKIYQSLFNALLIVGLMSACGEVFEDKTSDKEDKAEQPAEQNVIADLNAQSAVENCSFATPSGKVSGIGKELCEKLAAEHGADKKMPAEAAANYKAACAFDINGKKEESTDPAVCEALKKKYAGSFDLPGTVLGNGDAKIACSYAINGVQKQGSTAAECEALKKEFMATFPAIVVPPVKPVPAAPAGNSSIQCSYSNNGVTESGNSQAECDALKKKYGA